MKVNELEEAEKAVTMAMAMAVTVRLISKGLLDKPKQASNEEEKYAAVLEGIEEIKDEVETSFREDEHAQEMKVKVLDFLIQHHKNYFGYGEVVENEAGE